MKNHHSQKAYKKCIICGSNFVTSETDSEVFCKDCQSHRDTAKTLQNLLEHINPNEKFSIGDLIPYYKFSALNNIINALMDDGLLDFNPNDNTYSLKDKRVLDDFLNKYLIDPETVELPPEEETYPFNYTKERHEIVIEAIKEGKTRKEAAKLAGINFNYLERWYIEGQKGIEPFKQYYEDYESNKKDPKKKSEEEIKKETEEFNLNKLKINKFIESIKYEFTVKKSAEISGLDYKQVQKWLYYGNRGEKPFNEFSKEYKDAKKEATKNRNIFKKSEAQRDSFIECIKNGNTMLEACKKAELRPEDVSKWIRKGKDDIKPYVKFYERYQKVKGSKKKQTPLEKDLEKYTKEKHETIINAIKEGKTITEAVKLAGISIREESRWYTYGQKGIEPFKQYYEDFNFWKKEGKKKEEIEKERSEFLKNYKKINIFIKAIMGGKSFREAVQVAELNEKQLQKWLNYGKQGIEPFKITFEEYEEVKNKKTQPRKIYSHKYTKNRHEIVINAIKEGKTRREAAKIAGVTLKDLGYWYNTGSNGKEPFKQYYEDYNKYKIDSRKKTEERLKKETKAFNQNSDKLNEYLIAKHEGKTRKEAAKLAGLDEKQIERWLGYGRNGKEPFKQFFNDYFNIIDTTPKKEDLIKKETEEFEQNIQKLGKFIQIIKEGESIKNAAKICGMDDKQIRKWLDYGQQGIEPFQQFKYEYKLAKKQHPSEEDGKLYPHNYTKKRHKIVINAIKKEKTRKEAAELAGITLKDMDYWYNKGKQGIKPFQHYYKDYELNKIDPHKKKEERIKRETEEFVQNYDERKKFLIAIKEGKTVKEAAEIAELNIKQVNNWIKNGREGIEPFQQFYEYYKKHKINPQQKKERRLKIEISEYDQNADKINKYLTAIKEGKTRKEAAEIAEIDEKQIIMWMNYGKDGIKPFKQFFIEYKISRKDYWYNINSDIGELKKFRKTVQEFLYIYDKEDIEEELLLKSGLVKQIKDWKIDGKENQQEYIRFLRRYRILKNKCQSNLKEYKENKEKREKFIREFKNHRDEAEALYKSGLKNQLFNKWIEKGKKLIKPYSEFFDSYNYLKINREFSLEAYNSSLFQQAVFLEKIADETTAHDALKISGLQKKQVIEWIRLGEEEIQPFKQFLEKYEKAKEESNNKKKRFKRNRDKRSIFIKYIENKDSMSQACRKAELQSEEVEDWLVKGKNGQKPYDTFYKEYQKGRENSTKRGKLDLDLTVLKEEKESLLISIKGKINEDSMGIVNNLIKTYNYSLYESSINRLNNNKLKISIKLKIKKNELDFIKSMLKSY